MMSITKTVCGRPQQIDLENLPLGNGLAHRVDRESLFTQMNELGVTNISPLMGRWQLLERLGVWQIEQREQSS